MLFTQTVLPTFTLLTAAKSEHYFAYIIWYDYFIAVEVHVTHQPIPDSNRHSVKNSQGELLPLHYCNYTSPCSSRWHSKPYSHGSNNPRLGLTSQNSILANVNASSCHQRNHNREKKAIQCYYVLCKICSLLINIYRHNLYLVSGSASKKKILPSLCCNCECGCLCYACPACRPTVHTHTTKGMVGNAL